MRALYPLLPLALAASLVGVARAEVTVPLDHAERLPIHGSAASVVVANPAIADVQVVDSHTLYVLGRGYGATGLTVTDALGRTLYAGDVTVVRPATSVSVFRGVSRSDFACAYNACSETRGGNGGGSGGGVSGASFAIAVAPPPQPATK